MMSKAFFLLAILLFVLPSSILSQPNQKLTLADSVLGKNYHDKANGFTKAAQYDSAIVYLIKASEVYKGIAALFDVKSMWEKYILMAYVLGGNYALDRNLKKALIYRKEGLQIAIAKFGAKHPLASRGYNNIGLVYVDLGDYDSALEHYEKAFNAFEDMAEAKNRYAITAYSNAGSIFMLRGDYDKALEYHVNALKASVKFFGEKHPMIAWRYNEIALDYAGKRNYNKAIEYYSQSVKIWQAQTESSADIASVYINMGNAYMNLNKLDEAKLYFDQALTVLLKHFGEQDERVASLYVSYGNFNTKKGDYVKAIEYTNKSLSIKQRLFGEFHSNLTGAYQNFGYFHTKIEDFTSSLSGYQKALFTLAPQFRTTNVLINPDLEQVSPNIQFLPILKGKAEALKDSVLQTDDQPTKLKCMLAALSTSELAINLIDKLYADFKAEGSKLDLSKEVVEVYEQAIHTAVGLYETTHDDTYRHKAYAFAARNKTAVLSQSLLATKAKYFAGIPDTLLDQERDLKLDIGLCQTKLQEHKQQMQPNSQKILELERTYSSLNDDYDKLLKRFEKNYPRYYDLKYEFYTPTVQEVQRALDGQTALIEYFLGSYHFYIFVITKNAFNLFSGIVDSSFYRMLDSYASSFKSITGNAKKQYLSNSLSIYQFLFRETESHLKDKPRWVIIPHNELYQIPFEALLRRAPSPQEDDTKLDYLIKHHEISYHYSTALFLKQYQARGKNSLTSTRQGMKPLLAQGLVGFAPVFGDGIKNGRFERRRAAIFADSTYRGENTFRETAEGLELKPLPYSEHELQTIVDMFKNRKKMGIGYFHQDAGEEKFKMEAGKFKIVHVSTHGLYNAKYPNLSGLAFSQHQPTPTNDGLLYAAEVYNLELHADLLALSSCESAVGPLQKGEGLMALTRAFIYAGVNNILASLWKVRDQHTSELMIAFYEEVLQGKRYGEALRAAKLKMIANPETAGPQSWAGFILIGK